MPRKRAVMASREEIQRLQLRETGETSKGVGSIIQIYVMYLGVLALLISAALFWFLWRHHIL